MIVEQCYQVLCISPNASLLDIERAYERLLKTWNPARFFQNSLLKQQAEEKIAQIDRAYHSLKAYLSVREDKQWKQPGVDLPPFEIELIDPESYYLQGMANYRQGNLLDAIEDFSRAIELDPKYVSAYQYRGFILEKLGFKDTARSDFEMVDLLYESMMAY